MRECDVFVCASWEDGFGLPGLEALACGAALATTDTKGSRDYAIDGRTALVSEPRDVGALGENIVRLLDEAALRRRLVAAARRHLDALYPDWSEASARLGARAGPPRRDVTATFWPVTTPVRPDDLPGVPVLRPRLPPAERLLPYLRRIDDARVYSNWGPLSAELESRVAERLGLTTGGVASAASGTAALVGAVLATAGRATAARPLALLPAYTFVATAVAVEQCGFRPGLVDVDPETWMLDPDRLAGHPGLDRVGVAVPVAAFGRPVPQEAWRRFRERTGIPVVVDGGAAFDRAVVTAGAVHGGAPVAFSFHATKSFSTGEGGAVASSDGELAEAVGHALNYGFRGTRESRGPSINGKMSEYHAAVGLAELDGWAEKLAALEDAGRRYHRAAAGQDLAGRLITAPEISASYVLLGCASAGQAERARAALRRAGVDHRMWYGAGLHAHRAFAGDRLEPLDVTDLLGQCLIGLPLAPDLDDEALGRVVAALREAG